VRKSSALAITETDDKLIASAAMIGLNNQPVTGYRTPAASGIGPLGANVQFEAIGD
jgi:hypothetical protein